MGKPFISCPKHGWTERVASLGPCKKCNNEEIDAAKSYPKGHLGDLIGIKIRVSDYLPDDEVIVSPATFKKIQEYFPNVERR
jgi:hypothetical protein